MTRVTANLRPGSKFDNLADQIDRNFDEYELESEKAGPVFQIMARYAF